MVILLQYVNMYFYIKINEIMKLQFVLEFKRTFNLNIEVVLHQSSFVTF